MRDITQAIQLDQERKETLAESLDFGPPVDSGVWACSAVSTPLFGPLVLLDHRLLHVELPTQAEHQQREQLVGVVRGIFVTADRKEALLSLGPNRDTHTELVRVGLPDGPVLGRWPLDGRRPLAVKLDPVTREGLVLFRDGGPAWWIGADGPQPVELGNVADATPSGGLAWALSRNGALRGLDPGRNQLLSTITAPALPPAPRSSGGGRSGTGDAGAGSAGDR